MWFQHALLILLSSALCWGGMEGVVDATIRSRIDEADDLISQSRRELEVPTSRDAMKWANLAEHLRARNMLWDQGGASLYSIWSAFANASWFAEQEAAVDVHAPVWMHRLAATAELHAIRTLISMHRYTDALACVARAMRLADGDRRVRCLISHEKGRALALLGEHGQAMFAFQLAISAWPSFTQNYAGLLEMARHGLPSHLQMALDEVEGRSHQGVGGVWAEASTADLGLLPDEQAHNGPFYGSDRTARAEYYYYALGGAHHQLGHWDRAWDATLLAHGYVQKASRALKEGQEAAGVVDYARDAAWTIKIFQQNFWPAGVGHTTSAPLFVVGVHMCGSAVVEHMIARHSQVRDLGHDSYFSAELPTVRDDIVATMDTGDDSAPSAEHVAALKRKVQFHADRILDGMILKANGSYFYGPEELKNMKEQGKEEDRALALLSARAAHDQGQDDGDDVASSSVGSFLFSSRAKTTDTDTKADKASRLYLLDKMGANFRNIGLIRLLYPHAKVVHVVRDPLDTLVSCFRAAGNGDEGWSTNLDELVDYYVSYLRIMAHWRKVLPGRVVDVQYERFLFQPDSAGRALVEHQLGLPWEESARTLRVDPRLGRVPGVPGVANTPLASLLEAADITSVGNWKMYAHRIPAELLLRLRMELVQLKEDGALPFPDSVNWDLDPGYDYGARLLPPMPDDQREGRGVNAPLDSRRPRWLADTWDGLGDRVAIE